MKITATLYLKGEDGKRIPLVQHDYTVETKNGKPITDDELKSFLECTELEMFDKYVEIGFRGEEFKKRMEESPLKGVVRTNEA